MIEKVSESALTHIKNLLQREREIESAINHWTFERVKTAHAKDNFLEFLNLEHDLKANDLIHPETGAITRVQEVPILEPGPTPDIALDAETTAPEEEQYG